MSPKYDKRLIVMVMDGAAWHNGLTEPPNLRVIKQPPYSPELNPVEHIWDEVREKHFHNRVFESLDALECESACNTDPLSPVIGTEN